MSRYTNNLDTRCRMFQDLEIHNGRIEELYMEHHGLEDGEFLFKDKNAEEGFWRTFSNKLSNLLSSAYVELEKVCLHDLIIEALEECVDEAIDIGIGMEIKTPDEDEVEDN